MQFHLKIFSINWQCSCPLFYSISKCLLSINGVFNLLNNNTYYWQFTSYYSYKRYVCSMIDEMYAHFEILLCDNDCMVDRFAQWKRKEKKNKWYALEECGSKTARERASRMASANCLNGKRVFLQKDDLHSCAFSFFNYMLTRVDDSRYFWCVSPIV